MKNAIFIQSRLSSSRFPGKMLEPLAGMPLVEYVYRRCLESVHVDMVAVITSEEASDDSLYAFCSEKEIPVFRGSLENVLERYVHAAVHFQAGMICRVCGDSPFVDVSAIDHMLDRMSQVEYQYIVTEDGLDGFVSEVVLLDVLQQALRETDKADDLEHVTPFIKKHPEKFRSTRCAIGCRPPELEKWKLTIDYPDDLLLANQIVQAGLGGFDFTSQDVVSALQKVIAKEIVP